MKEFTTTDIGLIAALVTFGLPYIEATVLSPTRVMFKFEDSDMLKQAVSAYFAGSLKVPANSFYNNIKSLRGVINGLLEKTREGESIPQHSQFKK